MNDLLILYGANVASSLIYNTAIYYKIHRDARKKTMKKLKYEGDLSKCTKKELRKMNKDFFDAAMVGVTKSFVPLVNILFTMGTINCYYEFQEDFEEEYSLIVDSANEKEELARQIYLEMLRQYKDDLDIDKATKDKIEDDNYRPSKKEFVKTLKYLKPETEIK